MNVIHDINMLVLENFELRNPISKFTFTDKISKYLSDRVKKGLSPGKIIDDISNKKLHSNEGGEPSFRNTINKLNETKPISGEGEVRGMVAQHGASTMSKLAKRIAEN